MVTRAVAVYNTSKHNWSSAYIEHKIFYGAHKHTQAHRRKIRQFCTKKPVLYGLVYGYQTLMNGTLLIAVAFWGGGTLHTARNVALKIRTFGTGCQTTGHADWKCIYSRR